MESAGEESGAAGPDPFTAVAQTETRQVDVHLPVADLASGACVQRVCKVKQGAACSAWTPPLTRSPTQRPVLI